MEIVFGVGSFLALVVALRIAFKAYLIHIGHLGPKLTPEQREQIAELESSLDEIEGSIASCKRLLVTSTDSWSYDYWMKRIGILTKRAADYRRQIDNIKNPTIVDQCWVDTMGPGRKVVGGCGHGQLVEVESGGQVVAYICEKCNAQVMPDDRAAVAHRERKAADEARAAEKRRVDEQWQRIWQTPDVREYLKERANVHRSELSREAGDNGLMDRDVAKHLANHQPETFDTTYASADPSQGLEGFVEFNDGRGNITRHYPELS